MESRRVHTPLPATVVALGVVSFLTDLSSEMIYPLLPAFLVTVLGAGAVALGVVEGVAEATAAVLKVVSGWWTDRARRRKPLVVAGYGLSGMARPFIAAAGSWPAVAGLRFADRVGKGLRTSPRDALIADVTHIGRRGEAFGFHRAMDHAGAVAGPLVAAALLALPFIDTRAVFALAAVPAVMVMIVLWKWVREPTDVGGGERSALRLARVAEFGPEFRGFLLAIAVFALGNSTDAFLLLRLTDAGVSVSWVAVLWSGLHVVKMTATWFGGRLSDRWGRKRLVISGWGVYALVYLGFAAVSTIGAYVTLFLAYGVYFGLTEPVERAWVATLAPAHLRGGAFGLYHGVIGLAALPASLLFGALYTWSGPAAAFGVGAVLAGAAALLLVRVPDTE